jgi:sugar phosphate isomerase/epimerase
VCDHVPYELDRAGVDAVAGTVTTSGLRVRSINGDIGDLNQPLGGSAREVRDSHLDRLLALAAATGARALVLPCGAADRCPIESLDADLDRVARELTRAAERAGKHGVELWTESLHYRRLCWNLERAQSLTDRLAGSPVRLVMDFSHIVASGGDPREFVDRFPGRIAHVHIRDAAPGNINLSVGRGRVDFAGGLKALADAGYAGHFALELETRDITDDQRPAATAQAAQLISELI